MNYWLNLILLEELANKLLKYYSGFIGKTWKSAGEMAIKMQEVRNMFYKNNPQYVKVANSIQIHFEIVDVKENEEIYYCLTSVEIFKI